MNHRLLFILAYCALGSTVAWGDDLDRCISAAKKTNLSCWNRCDAAEDECIADCDADFEARKQQCRSSSSASSNTSAGAGQTELSGTSKTGQDGCYYGECPPDLDKRIDKRTEDNADEEEPPRKSPRRQQPREQPQQDQPLDRSAFPPAAQVQMTRICQTPAFWCMMLVAGPVSSPCWCASVFGTANGITVPER